MKRTALLFAIAAALGLVALVLGFAPSTPSTLTPLVRPPVVVAPPPQVSGDTLKLTAALSDPLLLQGGAREVFLKIDVEAVKFGGQERAPVNLALVLDRSGSMAGDKIENARRAARQLVSQLDARDRFALVTFGGDVTTLITSAQATPEAKERMYAAIDGIAELGGTNISGGVEAGLGEVLPFKSGYNVNRIVLLSDGQANEGVVTPSGLSGLARKVSAQGVTLSSIGVGLDFNENVMEAMAEYGSGAYHFLADAEQLPTLFAQELQQAVATVASQPELSVTPQAGAVVQEVYGFTSEGRGGATAIRLPDFSSGQQRKVIVRMLVPANAAGVLSVANVGLTYADVTKNRAPGSAAVAVNATVTEDAQSAFASKNKDVARDAVQADALKTMREAGGYFSEGRKGEAKQKIAQAKKALLDAQTVYGASADFKAAEQEADVFENALSAPAAAPEAQMAAKRIHSFSSTAR